MADDLTEKQIDRRINEIARLVVSNPYKPRHPSKVPMADRDHWDRDAQWPRRNFDRAINDSRILLAESYALLRLVNARLADCRPGAPSNPA
jgi:hypothetical protein